MIIIPSLEQSIDLLWFKFKEYWFPSSESGLDYRTHKINDFVLGKKTLENKTHNEPHSVHLRAEGTVLGKSSSHILHADCFHYPPHHLYSPPPSLSSATPTPNTSMAP